MARRRSAGFSLVELLVAMALGLLLTLAVATVYVSTKSGLRRQTQLAELQRNVRIAFDYLSQDARMAGHAGCFTGRSSGFTSTLSATSLVTNFGTGLEGYEYANATPKAYALSSTQPANATDATLWRVNASSAGVNTIPLALIDPAGLAPGSDVLVIRTVAGAPVRLAAGATAGSAKVVVPANASGKCSDGTDKTSGFCTSSYGLLASCTNAQAFTVTSIATGELTVDATLSATYDASGSELFALQTIAYYVKRSSDGSTTSLYRKLFDGDHAAGLEQELVSGVENMQLRYGVDTSAPPDGVIDEDYKAADSVADWNTVVSVRMGLLLRSPDQADADAALPTSALVDEVSVAFPGGKPLYDRRVFTTTVALRNRIAY